MNRDDPVTPMSVDPEQRALDILQRLLENYLYWQSQAEEYGQYYLTIDSHEWCLFELDEDLKKLPWDERVALWNVYVQGLRPTEVAQGPLKLPTGKAVLEVCQRGLRSLLALHREVLQ